MKLGKLSVETENPSEYIRQILSEYKSPKFDYLPSFTGGLVGYFSYDYLGYKEKSIRGKARDTEDFKDVDLMLFDKVIAFDNLCQKIILIANMSLDAPETGYNKAIVELKQLRELLMHGEKNRIWVVSCWAMSHRFLKRSSIVRWSRRQSTISKRGIFSR